MSHPIQCRTIMVTITRVGPYHLPESRYWQNPMLSNNFKILEYLARWLISDTQSHYSKHTLYLNCLADVQCVIWNNYVEITNDHIIYGFICRYMICICEIKLSHVLSLTLYFLVRCYFYIFTFYSCNWHLSAVCRIITRYSVATGKGSSDCSTMLLP